MAKFNIKSFLKLSKKEQASQIESLSKDLIRRLPDLKKNLKSYDDVSDELYNLKQDELELISSTYSKAVVDGEISTPSSKRAYNKFIRQLNKYARMSMKSLVSMSTTRRINDFILNVEKNASKEEIEYMHELLDNMTAEQKHAFTMSKYFLNVSNWNSDDFVKSIGNTGYSMMTLELELFCKKYGIVTDKNKNLYNTHVATDGLNKVRKGYRAKNK